MTENELYQRLANAGYGQDVANQAHYTIHASRQRDRATALAILLDMLGVLGPKAKPVQFRTYEKVTTPDGPGVWLEEHDGRARVLLDDGAHGWFPRGQVTAR